VCVPPPRQYIEMEDLAGFYFKAECAKTGNRGNVQVRYGVALAYVVARFNSSMRVRCCVPEARGLVFTG